MERNLLQIVSILFLSPVLEQTSNELTLNVEACAVALIAVVWLRREDARRHPYAVAALTRWLRWHAPSAAAGPDRSFRYRVCEVFCLYRYGEQIISQWRGAGRSWGRVRRVVRL